MQIRQNLKNSNFEINGESILPIHKKRNGLNYIVQHVLFLPLISGFVVGNLNLSLLTFLVFAVRLNFHFRSIFKREC